MKKRHLKPAWQKTILISFFMKLALFTSLNDFQPSVATLLSLMGLCAWLVIEALVLNKWAVMEV